jgi:CheY-like chemotaxis protein
MVVDDNDEILDLFKDLFEELKYPVLLARDGYEALRLFKNERPDVVFLDIKMPGPDGIETLKKLKQLDNGHNTTVVMITGYGDVETARQSMRLGAHEYLTKPIDLNAIKFICEEITEETVVVNA